MFLKPMNVRFRVSEKSIFKNNPLKIEIKSKAKYGFIFMLLLCSSLAVLSTYNQEFLQHFHMGNFQPHNKRYF
jgi:hypothetical protein